MSPGSVISGKLRDRQRPPEIVGILDEGHHKVIWRDIVKIAGMHQDVFFPKQPQGGLLFILRKPQRDVEAPFRRGEPAAGKTFDRGVPALRDPLFVRCKEIPALFKDLWDGELRRLVDGQERVRDQFQSRKRLIDKMLVAGYAEPSDLHSRQREHLREAIQREDQRSIGKRRTGKRLELEEELIEDFVCTIGTSYRAATRPVRAVDSPATMPVGLWGEIRRWRASWH
jgi:hypothetical protein